MFSGADNPSTSELVRLAIPRRTYTQSHIDYVAEACAEVYERRNTLVGLRMTNNPPFLRHFTAKFEELAGVPVVPAQSPSQGG